MLSSLPSSFGDLRNLRYLDLSGCKNLRRLPVSFENLMLLKYLNLKDCEELIVTSGNFQNIRKLEFLCLPWCEPSEELARDITNQASLRELYLDGASYQNRKPLINKLRELYLDGEESSRQSDLLTSLPNSLGDLSFLTRLSIVCCPDLESLPTSLGDLFSLTSLRIFQCPALECSLSVGRLNLLEDLVIKHCPISHVDFGAASLPFALSNLKLIDLNQTNVCRLSIPEDRYPRLESLELWYNDHLTEIGTLPTTVKSIKLGYCEMLKIIRISGGLVNLERLRIELCPELDKLPSFARSTSLRSFYLYGCYRIQKIEGLQYCTRLECLVIDTCWEVPGIESLEHMKNLRNVFLNANKGSAIERCIQTIQTWPDEIVICTRAVPDACSVVDSLLSPNLVVVNSICNQKISSALTVRKGHSSNGDASMVCFVINSFDTIIHGSTLSCSLKRSEKCRWAWVGVFSGFAQGISSIFGDGEMEKGLVVRGEKQRLVEAFHRLLPLLQS